ncbi:hypothetical protein MKX01_002341 [Papaver californicum]|nr:hypothetical protein MKX01_002341 [Papaver californicum]
MSFPWGTLLMIQEIDSDSRRCPEFEKKLYEDQFNLIHLASEYGYVEIVKKLISVNTIKGRMSGCFQYDIVFKSPLHYAAMKGNTEIINFLLDTFLLPEIPSIVYLSQYLPHEIEQLMAALNLSLIGNHKKVEIIKTTNKVISHSILFLFYFLISKLWHRRSLDQFLLIEIPRLSDDVPTKGFKALNEKLLSTIRWRGLQEYNSLEDFLASDPLLFKTLSSRSCPLQTQLYFYVLIRQTDDLLDEIFKSRCGFKSNKYQDQYPMHDASSWGFIHIVELILVYESGWGTVCLKKDMDGNTPLHSAALGGEVGVINMLLSTCWECAGMVSDKKNETALHCALRSYKDKPFKTLLEWYIIKEEFLNNNARDWECEGTALDQLVDAYVKIVKELLCQSDSKVCFQGEYREEKEYFVVIKCKNKETIETSFEYGDYIREVTSKTTNRTILSLSIDSRSIITLKVLIRSVTVRGILDVKDVDGYTVFDLLHYEAFSKLQVEDPEILDYVCELPLGGTPLHIAVRFGQLNDCTKEIIRVRPDFAARKDHKGRNPIHIASARGFLEIVKELLTQIGFSQSFARLNLPDIRGIFYGTPLDCAIQRGRISVFNELLSVWLKCSRAESREPNENLLRFAVANKQFEALKMLMERCIENELLKAKEVDGNPMSALADGYIEIISKHLLSPKVNCILSILVKNRDNGKTTGTQLPLPDQYFAVIKVTSSSRRKGNNIVDELQLSAYYPKYFRQVTVRNKMVLHLWMDKYKTSVTLKILMRSPLFSYHNRSYGIDGNTMSAMTDDFI